MLMSRFRCRIICFHRAPVGGILGNIEACEVATVYDNILVRFQEACFKLVGRRVLEVALDQSPGF